MNLLVDTHALLWFVAGDQRLSLRARSTMEDPANTIFISAVTAWEVAVKVTAGRLSLPIPPDALFGSLLRSPRARPLSLEIRHALRVGELPPLHSDPMDRLLIAQSQIESLPLVTRDVHIRQYEVETVW